MANTDPASLQNLHDIIGASPIPWWPPAPGWYAVGGGLLIGLVWAGWRLRRRWKKNAYRREAVSQLQDLTTRLKQDEQRKPALRALGALVKRTALAVWPRSQIAGLSGDVWLAVLDRSGRTTEFGAGPGQLLAHIAYAPDDALDRITDSEIAALVGVTERWLRIHRIEDV